jgi:hypothetical protein
MKPPFFTRILLFAFAGAAEAECVAGDLEEEFAILRQSRGSPAAARWYASQVMRSAWPLLQLRIRTGELTQLMLLAAFGVAAPLLALDKLWQFVYSRIPFKAGLDRAPQLLELNACVVCACAAAMGAWSGSGNGPSKSRALALAFATGCAAAIAIWASVGTAPAFYAIAIVLAAPAVSLFASATRRRSK